MNGRVLFIFCIWTAFLFAQDYKKEFEKLWKTNDTQQQASAMEKLAEGGDLNAAKMLINALSELAQKQERYEGQIEAKAKEATAFPYGSEKNMAIQSEILKWSDEIAQYNIIFDKAGEAIKKFTDPKAIKYLADEAFKGKNLSIKIATMTSLGALGNEDVTKILIKGLKDRSPKIRQLAVESLKESTPADALEPLIKTLSDDAWQVRSALAETLARYKDIRVVEPLIEQLKNEKGRLMTDIDQALEKLTGESHGGNYTVWRIRLKSEKEKWTKNLSGSAEEKTAPKERFDRSLRGTTRYYSSGASLGGGEPEKAEGANPNPKGNVISQALVPDSERLIYILDISGSMNEDAPAGLVKEAESAVGGKGSTKLAKIDVLITRFIQELPKLQPHQNFTIMLYNNKIEWWKKELVPATKANISSAQTYVKNIRAVDQTNTFGALEEAFNMAGRGSFDKNYDSGVDTIILVSDGLPSTGKFIVQFGKNDKGELREKTTIAFLDGVLRLNQLRRIKINTVGIPPIPMDDLLGGLAAESGGVYQYWELK